MIGSGIGGEGQKATSGNYIIYSSESSELQGPRYQSPKTLPRTSVIPIPKQKESPPPQTYPQGSGWGWGSLVSSFSSAMSSIIPGNSEEQKNASDPSSKSALEAECEIGDFELIGTSEEEESLLLCDEEESHSLGKGQSLLTLQLDQNKKHQAEVNELFSEWEQAAREAERSEAQTRLPELEQSLGPQKAEAALQRKKLETLEREIASLKEFIAQAETRKKEIESLLDKLANIRQNAKLNRILATHYQKSPSDVLESIKAHESLTKKAQEAENTQIELFQLDLKNLKARLKTEKTLLKEMEYEIQKVELEIPRLKKILEPRVAPHSPIVDSLDRLGPR